MKPRLVWPVILLAVGMALIGADAATLNGRYVATEPDPVTMTLRESKGGVVTGSLTQEGQSVPITAKRRGDKITGRVGGGDARLPFTAVVKGQHLTMEQKFQ